MIRDYLLTMFTKHQFVLKQQLCVCQRRSISNFNLKNFSWQEFARIYKQFFPYGDPSEFAAFVFNVFDENKVFGTLIKKIYYIQTIVLYVGISGTGKTDNLIHVRLFMIISHAKMITF